MNRLGGLIESSVGQKIIAGATGLALTLFLLVHMAGNLQVFAGATALNKYAEMLKSQALILWGARASLLGLFALHIAMTLRQKFRNRKLRKQEYQQRTYQKTTHASRYMSLTGSLILLFLIFHLLHFTGGVILPGAYEQTDAEGRHDVYAMVVGGFRNPWIVAIYVLGMVSLLGHLKHAVSSALQTLGILQQGYESKLRPIANWTAWIIVAGFLLVPVSIYCGFIGG